MDSNEVGHGLTAEVSGFDFGGRRGWCVVDGSLSQWLMGLTAIGLG